MKVFCLFLSLALLVGPHSSYVQASEASIPVSQESLPEVELDFDKDLNLDELEEEMMKTNILDTIKPVPPTTMIVWIRIIGCPMANAYFAVRRAFRNSVQKVAAFFHLKSAKKVHEESASV